MIGGEGVIEELTIAGYTGLGGPVSSLLFEPTTSSRIDMLLATLLKMILGS